MIQRRHAAQLFEAVTAVVVVHAAHFDDASPDITGQLCAPLRPDESGARPLLSVRFARRWRASRRALVIIRFIVRFLEHRDVPRHVSQ